MCFLWKEGNRAKRYFVKCEKFKGRTALPNPVYLWIERLEDGWSTVDDYEERYVDFPRDTRETSN